MSEPMSQHGDTIVSLLVYRKRWQKIIDWILRRRPYPAVIEAKVTYYVVGSDDASTSTITIKRSEVTG